MPKRRMTSTNTLLNRIADALGVPVEQFSNANANANALREHDDLVAMTALFARVREPADRWKILAQIQGIVEQQAPVDR